MRNTSLLAAFAASFITLFSCSEKGTAPSPTLIKGLSLKRGDVISCGPADQQLGDVSFAITGNEAANKDFALGVKLLHSFEYDEAEKVFARIIDGAPDCAMAYWGVAMSTFHALWTPPSEAELKKGAAALDIAKTLNNGTKKEKDYIEALSAFYTNWDKKDHRTRCLAYEKAMEALHASYPDDKEAATFYALSLNAAADPADKSFAKQKKAADILNALYPGESNHPGIVHYLIHTYDAPELAHLALPAARRYASVAPSSAHALHMPSHIFTRLGLWNEGIQSNIQSVRSAQCYAEAIGIKGHWDEELHGLDYLMYGYLQKGDNKNAKQQLDYLTTIDKVEPSNFKVAYAFAAIPARYVLENKAWKEAATLQPNRTVVQWEKFPWQAGITHFARLMGAVHTADHTAALAEMDTLKALHKKLMDDKDSYKASQIAIQMKTAEAWMALMDKKEDQAVALMKEAADMEDATEKHPVTPSEVLPAAELLGDMLLQLKKYNEALGAYERDLQKHPNRFNGLYGAAQAAEGKGDLEKAKKYYTILLQIAGQGSLERKELTTAKQFLKKG